MRDTPKVVEERYRTMLLELDPAERLKMSCRMFRTARALMMAGMHGEIEGSMHSQYIRRRIFLRLYGSEFSEMQIQAILDSLAGKSNTSAP